MTTKELVEAVEEARRKDFAEAAETFGRHAEAAVSALAAHALALDAALADAKARALEEAAEAWECDEDHDESGRTCPQRWLRARAADVRAGR